MPSQSRPAMTFGEFVAFVAACMALSAMSIDIMLPALPLLHADFKLADPNQAQAVIASFFIGIGSSQLFYGPLADRFGRKPILVAGLILFIFAGILTMIANSFTALLAARVLQGIGAGAPRVMAVSMVRDRYAGARMAKVMSLSMMTFMIVPVLAPSLGQLILMVTTHWHWVFGMLVVTGIALLTWAIRRLAETLPPEHRMPLTPRSVYSAYRQTLTTRRFVGYMMAVSLIFGAHIGFISSSQQILVNVFDAGRTFPLLFATLALASGMAVFANAKLVRRVGMRRLGMTGLAAIIVINLFHLWFNFAGYETLLVFMLMQGASMFMFGLLVPNLNALAMEPMGHIAGTASSMIGFASTTGGALIGLSIGLMFNGTVVPLAGAYVVLALASLIIAYHTEKPASTRNL